MEQEPSGKVRNQSEDACRLEEVLWKDKAMVSGFERVIKILAIFRMGKK